MDLFNILAILITLAAVFSYINFRYIGLPVTIGVMVIALAMSLMLNLLGSFGLGLKPQAELLLRNIDFDRTLLHGMLSFLLFAGALHIDINDLIQDRSTMSPMPVFMPKPPVGDMQWAASPAKKTRLLRNCLATSSRLVQGRMETIL